VIALEVSRMRTIFRAWNVVLSLALPIVLLAANIGKFAYSMNSCSPGPAE